MVLDTILSSMNSKCTTSLRQDKIRPPNLSPYPRSIVPFIQPRLATLVSCKISTVSPPRTLSAPIRQSTSIQGPAVNILEASLPYLSSDPTLPKSSSRSPQRMSSRAPQSRRHRTKLQCLWMTICPIQMSSAQSQPCDPTGPAASRSDELPSSLNTRIPKRLQTF